MNPPVPEDPEGQLRELLFAGKKIEAIKVLRAQSGQSLKDAKEAIEALEARLRTEFPDRMPAPSQAGCGTAAVLVLGASLAWYLF